MSPNRLPKPIVYTLLILLIIAMIPPVLIARSRAVNTSLPRIQLQQDMAVQHRFNAQQPNALFRDGRAMRPEIEGTVARGELRDDDHFYKGVVDDDWATEFPAQVNVDMDLLHRGQERYEIFCMVCHGADGFGEGMVHIRAEQRMNMIASMGTVWVAPTSLHEENVREQPVGYIYNVITNGVRTMAPYKDSIPVHDRWAITAYVRALQRSQDASPDDVAGSDDRDEPREVRLGHADSETSNQKGTDES